ncbi:MAG: galactose mutarotase [Microbacterium sp.]|uniref:aldose 1-epimerase family protein n=1 Tax=Microbacterium sp. TaxID=51671 RepID=UPI000DB3EBCE|nr:aldose 1-epimerase family protein [Microbacterium sp.]PZU37544.1 MAG: galactose mutarotase [Microbacterium sp.]
MTAAASRPDPTGRQFVLRSPEGRVGAQVAQLGASLRALRVDDTDLVTPYPAGAATPAASGIVLVPWPNRVRDGIWTQRGETRRLAISEPALGNAAHGLLRFAPYSADSTAESAGDTVTLRATVFPQTGYPFQLDTAVTYALRADGIHITHRIENIGKDDAPVALGTHPYLMIGGVDTATLTLRSSGATRFVVDARKLPTDEVPVDADTDLRAGRVVGELDLDTAYGALARDDDGRVRHSLTAPDGRRVTLWQGPGFEYAQIFTTDRYPGHPVAVAVEPMTAPADALNSGRGLRWLEPGENWTLEWGIVFGAPVLH